MLFIFYKHDNFDIITVSCNFHSSEFYFVYLFSAALYRQHHGIQHSNTHHYDIQHNDIQHNDTQHNGTQYNDTQHNDIQALLRILQSALLL